MSAVHLLYPKRYCYTDNLLSSFLMQMWQSEDLILTAAYDKMPGWEEEKDEMKGEVAGGRRFYVVLFVSCRGGVLRGAEKGDWNSPEKKCPLWKSKRRWGRNKKSNKMTLEILSSSVTSTGNSHPVVLKCQTAVHLCNKWQNYIMPFCNCVQQTSKSDLNHKQLMQWKCHFHKQLHKSLFKE